MGNHGNSAAEGVAPGAETKKAAMQGIAAFQG
jgi:hypothetical protein